MIFTFFVLKFIYIFLDATQGHANFFKSQISLLTDTKLINYNPKAAFSNVLLVWHPVLGEWCFRHNSAT